MLGESPVIDNEKAPTPVVAIVRVTAAINFIDPPTLIAGLGEVPYTTPISTIVSPPSKDMLPPLKAPV